LEISGAKKNNFNAEWIQVLIWNTPSVYASYLIGSRIVIFLNVFWADSIGTMHYSREIAEQASLGSNGSVSITYDVAPVLLGFMNTVLRSCPTKPYVT
jgi:hypothetical protein